MTYRDRPVFEWSLDWSDGAGSRREFELREVAVGFGTDGQFADQTELVRGWSGEVWLDDLDDIEALDAFTVALQGRLIGFWFPAPQAAFTISAGVSATQCDIEGEAFTATFGDRPGVYVWLTKDGQTAQAAKVLSAVVNGDGTSRVTFDESVTVDETWLAWDLAYVRLADDTEQGEFTSEQTFRRTIVVAELPHEYAEAETGERPVYLYRISVGEGDGTVDWLWTSFPWDVEAVMQDYVSQRVSHGAIKYDTAGIQQGVVLEVDREIDGSPFKLAFPAHGCQPITVEIKRGDYSDLSSVSTLFKGIVTSVAIDGRVLKATCSAWWGSEQSSVPAFLFGPRCPYRLFEPSTCRLARVDFQQSVTLGTITSRQVVVTGAGLTGATVNRFAEGWIEVGDGLTREIRLVLTSTAASGSSVTLNLNSPLRFNLAGASATILPGCDGRWTTCEDKFDNVANFGGHRFAMSNLAIKAMEIPATGGGAKK